MYKLEIKYYKNLLEQIIEIEDSIDTEIFFHTEGSAKKLINNFVMYWGKFFCKGESFLSLVDYYYSIKEKALKHTEIF